MKSKPLNILVSAYACGPNWGSEIGMGWNWVISLSNYCQLTVLTEKGFRKDIEEKLPELNLKYIPKFYYIDIGEKGRELFWKQGSFSFYSHYKNWQKKAYYMALNLITKEKYDIIHQLNMIGFREPGYLWKIKNTPFVWGPVGGYNQVPWNYIPSMSLKNTFFYSIKNVINILQIKLLSRPRSCANSASIIFAATKESEIQLKKISSIKPIILNETGCSLTENNRENKISKELKILWVGRIQGLKALPIALLALKKTEPSVKYRITIIGDGPDTNKCKFLIKKLNIEKNCVWLGRVPNNKVVEMMKQSNILLFTSLKEGTPHVITEALQNGLPILCHDSCGHGALVDSSCGVKIPQINQKNSIRSFANEISEIYQNPEKLSALTIGALNKAKEITWDSKAKNMVKEYFNLIR